jgi:hypothetical protein
VESALVSVVSVMGHLIVVRAEGLTTIAAHTCYSAATVHNGP